MNEIELENLKKIQLISSYIIHRQEDIEKYNSIKSMNDKYIKELNLLKENSQKINLLNR